MTKSRIVYAIVLLLSLSVVAAGIYRQVDRRSAAEANAVPVTLPERVLAPTPLTVSLSRMSSQRSAAIGGVSMLAVNAAGPVISQVRVYDGAALIGIRTFNPPARNRASVQVQWPAVREGAHVLHAEAVGEGATAVGHSSPVRLRAVPGVIAPKTVPLPANGRTPDQIAGATGVALGALRFTDAAGKAVPAPPSTRPLPSGITASAALSQIARTPPPATSTGTLTATLDGCRATVKGPAGATVYEMTGGSLGFVRRGTAPYTTKELTPGPHIFVAGQGNDPADSAPVSVDVPADCLDSLWDGNARLLDGELTLTEPASGVWVYLGVDGEPFRRYPATGAVSGAFGVADLTGALPSLRGKRLRMEVWRAGDTPSAPAVRLAQSSVDVRDPESLGELLGEAPGVRLTGKGGADTIDMSATSTEVTFDWHTESVQTTGVVWQVLGRPLPAGDHNTAPPVLLATGYSQHGGGQTVVTSGRGGRFPVPAGLLLGGRPATSIGDGALAAVPTPSMQQLIAPGSKFGTTAITAPITGSIETLPAGIVPVPIGDVYVRVLPVADDAVVGDASNTVAVTLPALSETVAGFTAVSVDFDPGYAANTGLANCVRITGSPAKVPNNSIYWRGDGTYCPTDFGTYKGRGCEGWCAFTQAVESLVDVIAQVWDYIAQAYNTVVDTVVTVIAKFNPVCLATSVTAAVSESKFADDAAEGCESVATVVASVAVAVVMSSFGLPARLPTSDQILDIAEGDLTGLAVAYLEQLGLPCSHMKVDASAVKAAEALPGADVPQEAKGPDGGVDLCAAMINQAIGAIREQVKQAADAETQNLTGLLPPPAPQQYEPEPRGQYHGARVQVIAKPIDPNTPKSARCPVVAQGHLREWDRGYEGMWAREIGVGSRHVAYSAWRALGGGQPWGASIRMAPVDTLYDTDEMSVKLTSPCFAEGSLPQIPKTSPRPPLGYWLPGQAD